MPNPDSNLGLRLPAGGLLDLFDTKWFGDEVPQVVAQQSKTCAGAADINKSINAPRIVNSASSGALDVIRADASGLTADSARTKRNNNTDSKAASMQHNDRQAGTQVQQAKHLTINGWERYQRKLPPQTTEPVGLGTWAGRQQIFLGRSPPGKPAQPAISTQAPRDVATNATQNSLEEIRPSGGVDLQQVESSFDGQPTGKGTEQEGIEDNDIHEAWRWRMGRKWQTEQHRIVNSVADGDEDDWTAALRYMAQAENGMDLQFGRLTSLDRFQSLASPTFSRSMSLLIDGGMSMKESSLEVGSIDAPAINQITSAMLKAQHLLKHQQEIERQLDTQWEQNVSLQQPWCGNFVSAAMLDSWGRFDFIIARVQQQNVGGQKLTRLLVRGKNGLQAQQIHRNLDLELSRAAAENRVAKPSLELLASGTMEWARDNQANRCLSISANRLFSLADTRLQKKHDVCRIAATISESAVPDNCQIMIKNA